jgi:hypothetical protein
LVKAVLRRASYHAERLLKQRGNFNSVLEHWRRSREIIWLKPRQPTLGAMSAPEPAGDRHRS